MLILLSKCHHSYPHTLMSLICFVSFVPDGSASYFFIRMTDRYKVNVRPNGELWAWMRHEAKKEKATLLHKKTTDR